MNEAIKNQINDLRVAIYRYHKGLAFSSSRSSIIRCAKKLIDIPEINNLLNEYNGLTSDKIEIQEAIDYINEAIENNKAKNINRNSHPILEKFDNVLQEHSDHLNIECTKHFNGLRNEFLEANKIKPIDSYSYARKKAEFVKPIDMITIQYERIISTKISEDPIHQLIQHLGFPYSNDELWNVWLEKKVNEIVKANKFKLYSAVIKKLKSLEIESIENEWIHTGSQGFEGNFILTLKNGEKKFFTVKSIYAGGYNIQCLHYRFLAKVK